MPTCANALTSPGAVRDYLRVNLGGLDHEVFVVPSSTPSIASSTANPTRTFASFSEAARENADSRVKAGLHFRFATIAGLKLGEDIAQHAVKHALTPVA